MPRYLQIQRKFRPLHWPYGKNPYIEQGHLLQSHDDDLLILTTSVNQKYIQVELSSKTSWLETIDYRTPKGIGFKTSKRLEHVQYPWGNDGAMNYLDLEWKKHPTWPIWPWNLDVVIYNFLYYMGRSFWKATGNKWVPNGYRTCIYLSHKIQISDSKHVHCVDLRSRMNQWK